MRDTNITIQQLAKMMGMSARDVAFKLRAIGLPVKDEDASVSTEAVRAILEGKKLSSPGEIVLRSNETKQELLLLQALEEPEAPLSKTEEPISPFDGLQEAVTQLNKKIENIENELNSIRAQATIKKSLANRLDQIEEKLHDLVSSDYINRLTAALEPEVTEAVKNYFQENIGNSSLEDWAERLLADAVENIHEEIISVAQDQAANIARGESAEYTTDDLDKSIYEIKTHLDALERHLNSQVYQPFNRLVQRLNTVETNMTKPKEPPLAVKQIIDRAYTAQNLGKKLQSTTFRSPLSPTELVVKLRELSFFIPEHIAKDIIEKLESKKIVVLDGVPGTGKSRLARHLADLLLPHISGDKFTQVSVFPEATTWHSIGGLRMIEGYFAPHFGWVTEAALKCIESDGCHWLILDEINRGDTSNLLGPVLDALEPSREGGIEHPHLFPSSNPQEGTIPLPGNFRIIGTRNPFDNDVLFDFTHALARRIGTVLVPPLQSIEESALIDLVVVRRKMREFQFLSDDTDKFKATYNIVPVLARMTQVLSHIRSLTSREPAHFYRQCEIGTALVMEMAEQVCKRCMEIYPTDHVNGDAIVDSVLKAVLFDRTDQYSRQVLKCFRDEVFDNLWAPECWARVNEGLKP